MRENSFIMTKTIIITAISSVLSLSAIARTVDLPLVDKSAHLTFIRSVELTDTATRFNMSMIGRPGKSISIDSMVIKGHETGKVY